MTNEEREVAMFEGFRFAVRVYAIAFDAEVPLSELPRLWQLMREIADGNTTIADRFIDAIARSGDDDAEWTQTLRDVATRQILIDRVTATRIRDGARRLAEIGE